jgi:hypothetical protein
MKPIVAEINLGVPSAMTHICTYGADAELTHSAELA